ncbi:hypothetical protein [Novosphingobium sp.]|uniref:hypothetical protein n=1 Tax=Novosphingobium sp. TaxID=1874826 RepID=UPI0022C41B8B|nr:hypothetical protein [Novosphingobium sp.]MCZ8074552.1 hypothetical protein [Roseateles sp.]MCZ8085572.1 hypothetical protein [Paracoccaceae bacterium]MCZ8091889.1 hypothetical protein [Acidovorax sp.]MCZ8227702.1 hypothetical protein [Burkholderiaceae bacterium]MCZ8233514.1 hypothetical protein [Novosphingobium sp.]
MSSQENLGKSDAQQPLIAGLLAVSTLLLVQQSGWIWQSLYFQFYPVAELLIALALMLFVFNVCVVILRLFFGHAISYKVTNASIGLLFSFIMFNYLTKIGLFPAEPTTLLKALALAFGLVASLFTLKINSNLWKRLHLAVIIGGGIFTFTPLLLANVLAPTVYWPSPSNQPATQKAPKLPAQNNIVLLLDEFSADAAEPVVDQLKGAGLDVASFSIEPAGENTINVIPAIWTRSNFDQSAPCGPTQLCSAGDVLDFSKVHASSDNIDIVGFYHRYCSIQGLRSCTFAPLPKNNAITDLSCSFPGVGHLKFIGCSSAYEYKRSSFISLRENILNNTFKAPFWQSGGVLFVHLLTPHPLMGIPLRPLNHEYNENILHSADTVRLVAEKAKSAFRNNFRIIVFSDHPLRKEFWCSDKTYQKFGCKVESSNISRQVPLIIAAPSYEQFVHKSIKNNQNIFDILYQ